MTHAELHAYFRSICNPGDVDGYAELKAVCGECRPRLEGFE